MAEVKDQTRQLTERVDGGDIAEEGIAANRGDEGVLEGAIIGDVSPESSSDSEEEVFLTVELKTCYLSTILIGRRSCYTCWQGKFSQEDKLQALG